MRYGPWRIAGLSGIYKADDYRLPHVERLPYDRNGIKSVYHLRDFEVGKLLCLTGQVDVCLSHDWPMWVELFGDHHTLYGVKPHLLDSAKVGGLGSFPALNVLGKVRPRYWFSGHMHTRFEAKVEHKDQDIEVTIQELSISESLRSTLPILKSPSGSLSSKDSPVVGKTEFLALSKAGHSTDSYMALMELDLPIHADEEKYLELSEAGRFALHYDEEWLAITRAFNEALRIPDPDTLIVPPQKHRQKISSAIIAQNREWVKENITENGLLRIQQNFERHAPVQTQSLEGARDQPPEYPNGQTAAFAELLQMTNKFSMDTRGSLGDTGIDFVDFTLNE